ncbi:MAG: hypoxanthine phosphoribosyltransferase [Bacteroidota bacterium]
MPFFEKDGKKYYSIKGLKFTKYLDRERISAKVKEIAARINLDYEERTPVLLVILKGSIIFAADLMRELNVDCKIDTIKARSYGDSMDSTGEVQISDMSEEIKGKDIIIIEDIVDTGLTIHTLIQELHKFHPATVEVATLLSKPGMRKMEVEIKYIGIEVPNTFVVGYGLDYAGYGRNLDGIYALSD